MPRTRCWFGPSLGATRDVSASPNHNQRLLHSLLLGDPSSPNGTLVVRCGAGFWFGKSGGGCNGGSHTRWVRCSCPPFFFGTTQPSNRRTVDTWWFGWARGSSSPPQCATDGRVPQRDCLCGTPNRGSPVGVLRITGYGNLRTTNLESQVRVFILVLSLSFGLINLQPESFFVAAAESLPLLQQ